MTTRSASASISGLRARSPATCTKSGTQHSTLHRTWHITTHMSTISTMLFVRASFSRRNGSATKSFRRIDRLAREDKALEMCWSARMEAAVRDRSGSLRCLVRYLLQPFLPVRSLSARKYRDAICRQSKRVMA